MSVRGPMFGVMTTLVVLSVFATSANAQAYYTTGHYPYTGGGYGGYYGGYHSGTLAEGILRGRADLVEAYGVASLYYAQALRQREEARSLLIENQLAVRQHYAEQRTIREEERQALRTLRRQRALRIAEERQEQRAAQTANIDWPAELRGDQYAAARTEIEALAELQRHLGDNAGEGTSAAVHHAVRKLARQVIEDEESNRLNDEQSQVVRQFVRRLPAVILHDNPSPSPATESLAMSGSHRR